LVNELAQGPEGPDSGLQKRLDEELFNEGDSALTVSYADALVVLEYMRIQYDSAPDKNSTDFRLKDKFVEHEGFHDLFMQAFNHPSKDHSHPEGEERFYGDCSELYDHLRPLADEVQESVADKKAGVEKLSTRLHRFSAESGGWIHRTISRDDKFR